MTVVVRTVDMAIGWVSALMTGADDVGSDPLSHPVIKDKILSDELCFESFGLYLPCIMNDASVELVYIFETVMT